MERPTDLLAHAQIFSSYKHHNVMKYLIGKLHRGLLVSFLKVGTDVLVISYNILSNLLPGDTLLADRGFIIKESLSSNVLCSCYITILYKREKAINWYKI